MTTTAIAAPLTLKIGRKHYAVPNLAEASRLYSAARDRSGLGASRVPSAPIYEGSRQIAYISYNGRVWAGTEYVAGAVPLYVPGVA